MPLRFNRIKQLNLDQAMDGFFTSNILSLLEFFKKGDDRNGLSEPSR